ncbi:flagellar basal body rod protein FlgC [Massilia sp. TW-1]|uniref:Flagellar basal-body rod protein FlgC n=1 Tax=Telluria antibiotica TaxID=2717319 RepID=A0ABX0PER1_9BURK|nr:flagellar basal body rod protein FlgC [Telluria antibiotica]NIA55038.1 flagellar basal body rod protein FlgC [Telluria antibiotica]
MDYNAAFQISASGMALEKMRLDVTAANIANMNTAAASAGQVYQPLRVQSRPVALSFSQQFGQLMALQGGGVEITGVEAQPVPARMVYEPGNVYADAKGFVAYPGVDHTAEMLALNNALRAYDANVAAMSAAKAMAARALDIGGRE